MNWRELREQSAKRHGIKSWAVDTTYHISHIHVIESLDSDVETLTGTELFVDLQARCKGTPVTPLLHKVPDRSALFDVLDGIRQDAQRGQYPLLHFETHGIGPTSDEEVSPGLSLVNEDVTWRELAPFLTTINTITRLNLIVFTAACHGADLSSVIQPLEPAPIRLVVGPMESLSVRAIGLATRAFYDTLLATSNGNAAFAAIEPALYPGDPGFWKVPAEALFLEIVKGYFNLPTTDELIDARVEADIKTMIENGLDENTAASARDRRRYEIHDEIFDQCYEIFFGVDKNPEIAERFVLSFKGCFAL